MNHNLCREFIQHLDRDDSLQSNKAPEHIAGWLEGLGLPMDFLRFAQWDWPQSDGYIGHIRIMSSASIYGDEATPLLAEHGFFHAGSAPNGDWFVIDFSTEDCVPGFITHEEWSPWEDNPESPRGYFQAIARSFDSFLYRAVEERYLPTDYYAAKDFNAFLADEFEQADRMGGGKRHPPGRRDVRRS